MTTHYFQLPVSDVQISKAEGWQETLRIRGIASTPVIDRHDDIVDFEAMKQAGFGYLENPVVLLQHRSEDVIGQTLSYIVDEADQQIEVVMELNNDIKGVFDNVRKGNLRALSIGFNLKSWRIDRIEEREIMVITGLELLEISVVTIPANPQAYFTLEKSLKAMRDTIKSQPTNDDEIVGETPAQEPEMEPVNEEVKQEEWNAPHETQTESTAEPSPEVVEEVQSEPETWNTDKALEEVSTRVAKLEETITALSEQVSHFTKSERTADEVKKELAELKAKLAKTEMYVGKTSNILGIDARTGNVIIS